MMEGVDVISLMCFILILLELKDMLSRSSMVFSWFRFRVNFLNKQKMHQMINVIGGFSVRYEVIDFP